VEAILQLAAVVLEICLENADENLTKLNAVQTMLRQLDC